MRGRIVEPIGEACDLLSGPFRTIREFDGHRDTLRPLQADQAVCSYFRSWGTFQRLLKLRRVFRDVEGILAIEEQVGTDKWSLLNRWFRWIDLKQLGTIGLHCQ